MDVSRFGTFIFDLDGTIWSWKKLYAGSAETIEKLRKMGKQILFVTNNTLLSRDKMFKRIRNFGIDLEKEDLITSGLVTKEYLKNREGKVMVFGDGIKEDLKKGKIKISKKDADYLVVGYDKDFNYKKLVTAVKVLNNGARFLTTSKGEWLVIDGNLIPGTGIIVKILERATNRKSLLMGKPSKYMLSFLSLFVQSPFKRTVLVGDELESDILMGKKAGYFTVLVRSGVDKKVKKIKPDLVINYVKDLI